MIQFQIHYTADSDCSYFIDPLSKGTHLTCTSCANIDASAAPMLCPVKYSRRRSTPPPPPPPSSGSTSAIIHANTLSALSGWDWRGSSRRALQGTGNRVRMGCISISHRKRVNYLGLCLQVSAGFINILEHQVHLC